MNRLTLSLLTAMLLLLPACDTGGQVKNANDAGGEVSADVAADASADAGGDAQVDAGADVPDPPVDVTPDAPAETTPDTADPCESLQCAQLCVSDEDCGDFGACVFTEEGCCSACGPIACVDDADCPDCSSCAGEEGQCLPIPCPVECTSDEDCGAGERCEESVPGCCGACVPDEEPDCGQYGCLPTCVSDADCDVSMGAVCVEHAEGCCTACMPSCEGVCALEPGVYCTPDTRDDACVLMSIEALEIGPCVFEIVATGKDGTEDRALVSGCGTPSFNLPNNGCGVQFDTATHELLVACNWCGQFPYHPSHCGCEPDCDGKQCGDDGCGGSCGSCDVGCTCDASGICLGCGGGEIEMTPLCVHVPSVVPAGSVIPVAIYGEAGCDTFTHVEVEQNGTDYAIKVKGHSDLTGQCAPYEACELQDWIYSGMVLLDAPNPGSYSVTVADSYYKQVGATGGIIEEPACPPACAEPVLEDWDWTFRRVTSQEVTGECFSTQSGGYLGTPFGFDGGCQTYTVDATNWPWSPQVMACTNGHLWFGEQAPYWTEATVCEGKPSVQPAYQIMLGITQGAAGGVDQPAMFVIEGVEGVTGATP
jgi:hypothetical protein